MLHELGIEYRGGPLHGLRRTVKSPAIPILGELNNWKRLAVCWMIHDPSAPGGHVKTMYTLDMNNENRWRFLEGLPLIMLCAGVVED